jgi:hypothetical protein
MRWEEMDKGQTPLAALARQFESYCRLEGKPETTCGWYRHILERYLAWARDSHLADFTLERVRDYLAVNEPNAISGQVNFAGIGPHPLYVGLQTHVSTGVSDPNTFTTVDVPNIPSTTTLNLDKTSHANVDFSPSPGTITVYSGPLPGANDGQQALKAILTNTPTSVHANWNLGFPGGINVTSSNPVEIALLSQDSGGRNVADFIVQNLSASWGIKTFAPDVSCIDATPLCTINIVAIAAFANFNATPGVKGFFVNYTFKGGPGALNPAGPSPNASEYVPQWTFEAANFTTINVEAGIKICIASDGSVCGELTKLCPGDGQDTGVEIRRLGWLGFSLLTAPLFHRPLQNPLFRI